MKPPISVILLVSFLKHCRRSLVRMKYLSFHREKSLSLCCHSNPFFMLEFSPSKTSSAPTSEEICNNKIEFEIKFVCVSYTIGRWKLNIWGEGNWETISQTWRCLELSQLCTTPFQLAGLINRIDWLTGWFTVGGVNLVVRQSGHLTYVPRQFHAQFHVSYYGGELYCILKFCWTTILKLYIWCWY